MRYVLVGVLLLSALGTAQTSEVPVLSEAAKQQIKLHMLTMENLQLKFEAEKNALVKLLQTLDRPGFTLELGTLTYQPKPQEPTP